MTTKDGGSIGAGPNFARLVQPRSDRGLTRQCSSRDTALAKCARTASDAFSSGQTPQPGVHRPGSPQDAPLGERCTGCPSFYWPGFRDRLTPVRTVQPHSVPNPGARLPFALLKATRAYKYESNRANILGSMNMAAPFSLNRTLGHSSKASHQPREVRPSAALDCWALLRYRSGILSYASLSSSPFGKFFATPALIDLIWGRNFSNSQRYLTETEGSFAPIPRATICCRQHR